MHFDDLAATIGPHEVASDLPTPDGAYIVARLHGRGFASKLTSGRHDFDFPFDLRVRDLMIATADHLMRCGFDVHYGYTHGDEISLLLRRDAAFDRDLARSISVLAGEASAKFTLLLGDLACFECRISELADATQAIDYFRGRQADAARDAFDAHCHWALRRTGASAEAAASHLHDLAPRERHALLTRHGIDFDTLPAWQKHGAALHWVHHTTPNLPPTHQSAEALRRRLRVELELPHGDAYTTMLRAQIS